MSQKTAQLSIVRAEPDRFCWGKVIKIHTIGPYDLIEYIPEEWMAASGKTRFQIYANEMDQQLSADTLERALLYAMGRRHLASHRHEAGLVTSAAKLLELPESDS